MFKKETSFKLFVSKKVYFITNSEQEKRYISNVDVLKMLAESNRLRKYLDGLKCKLQAEDSELSDFFGQLKMLFFNGKFYKTNIANVDQLFRLIPSIASPKAAPFKIFKIN